MLLGLIFLNHENHRCEANHRRHPGAGKGRFPEDRGGMSQLAQRFIRLNFLDGLENPRIKPGRNPVLHLLGASRTDQGLVEHVAIHRR